MDLRFRLHRAKRPLLLGGPVVLIAVVGISWLTSSPGDLSLLAPHAERYGYDRLLAQLKTQDAPNDSFRFVVLGDSRNNIAVAGGVFEQAATEQPVMIFHTGDMIRGGTVKEYLENYVPLLEAVDPIPVFAVPGNHERGDRHDYAAFKALYGDTRFSFDYGPCRFVGLNVSEKVSVTSSDLEYLEAELSRPGAEHKFVFFHVPPKYFEGQVATDDRRGFDWNADQFRDLLSRHRATEVFMAHIHGYATSVIDDVRYTLSAGAGASFSDRLPEEGRIFHYMVVHVSPEGLSEELVYLDASTGEWRRRTVY